MRDNPKPFEIYKHFKGNVYQILNIAKDSEDGHLVVVYQALYGDYQIYVRDLEQFLSPVDKQKYPDVTDAYRFTKVDSKQSGVGTKLAKNINEYSAKNINTDLVETPLTTSDSSEINKVKSEAESVVLEKRQTAVEESEEEYHLDPMVEQFLDADSNTEKLNILAGIHKRVTKEMLQIMSLTMDIELNPGSVEEQYEELKHCLLMREKFEAERRG